MGTPARKIENQVEESRLLTPEEVCEKLRNAIAVGTLRKWRGLHKGPNWVRVGNKALYPEADLMEWLEETKTVIID